MLPRHLVFDSRLTAFANGLEPRAPAQRGDQELGRPPTPWCDSCARSTRAWGRRPRAARDRPRLLGSQMIPRSSPAPVDRAVPLGPSDARGWSYRGVLAACREWVRRPCRDSSPS